MAAFEMTPNGPRRLPDPDADGNDVDISTLEPLAIAGPAPPVIVTTSGPRTASPQPITAAQLTRDIRARLKVVRREIAFRKRLEREEQQLLRLLKAAKDQSTNVRHIRATG